MESKKLLVLASINADFNLITSRFPEQGETISANHFTMTLGGKGANQAFYAAQCGIETIMLCSVGQDYFGEFVLKELETNSLTVKPHFTSIGTGKAFVFIHDGDNRIILDPGANYHFDQAEINQEIISSGAKYFLSQLEVPYETVLASFQLAKENKLITVLNPAPANIVDQQIYSLTDYLILNETEANLLSKMKVDVNNQTSWKEVNKYFLNLGVKNVILTLGKHGSFFKNQNQEYFVPALKIQALNSTGAGDSYIGAFLAKLMNDIDVKIAMEFATKVAAHVCLNQATQVRLDFQKEKLWTQN